MGPSESTVPRNATAQWTFVTQWSGVSVSHVNYLNPFIYTHIHTPTHTNRLPKVANCRYKVQNLHILNRLVLVV